MSLVNTKLLGNTFVNDPKPGWIKINGVVLGNSPEYGYSSVKSNDVSSLLDKCYNDKNIVVVLYNWSNGQAYTKSGFNLSNIQDYSLNAVYTTFVIESRINKNNLPRVPELEKQRKELPIVPPVIDTPGQKLIGVQFLGKKFEQDPKQAWIKINQLTIGKSQQFGYNIAHSNNIGQLLDELIKDQNIVVAVYNHKTGIAYLKKGFDLTKSTDIAIDNDYTSFVVKNKVTSSMAPNSVLIGGGVSVEVPVSVSVPVEVPVEVPVSVPVSSQPVPVSSDDKSGFVSWNRNASKFQLNNKKFVPCGFNSYWLGLTEWREYPTHAQITEMFDIAIRMKATVIRAHTLGCNFDNPKSLRPYDNNLNEAAYEPIDFSFNEARRTGIKLMIPMCDAYQYYHGSIASFTRSRGLNTEQFWYNQDVRNDFKDFIYKWMNHTNQYTGIQYKNSPEILFIETGNELGNIRPDAGSTSIPTQEWTTDITKYIKSLAPNIMVFDGCDEALGHDTARNFDITETDAVGAHFYWNDYQRLENGASRAQSVGKPYIIGEYSSHFGQDWFDKIESTPNVYGSILWSMYPHNEDGTRVPHEDGFTLYYPEDMQQLTLISNHFRRIQGLPTVDSI